MSATYCIGPFSRRIGKAAVTREAYKAELAQVPETCDRPDCSPGGCRKHCTEFARGCWVKAVAAERRA